jgi:DNA-binding LytR/AlgR family response regulator
MKVIIIEDEKLSAEHLIRLLQRIDSGMEITHQFDSVKQTVKALEEGVSADLLFLDIHLADGLSFDIFSKVSVDIPIIFTTAYDDYAIKAFKQNSVDYLLKPIGMLELKNAIDKFKKYVLQAKPTDNENLSSVYKQMTKAYKNRFIVKQGSTIDSIKTEDILHFQTQEGLTFLVNAQGKRFPIDYTLDQLQEVLPPEQFFRINRKAIVNIKTIDKVSTHLNSRLHITAKYLDGDMAIVSRDRVNDFKLWLDS